MPLIGLVQMEVDSEWVVVLDVHVNVLVVEYQVYALVGRRQVFRNSVALLIELEELDWQQMFIFPFGLLLLIHPLLFLHDLVSSQNCVTSSLLFVLVPEYHGLFLGVFHQLIEASEP